MAAARLAYVAPWWTYWLHNFPHVDFLLQPVDNAFRPEEQSYQQVGGFPTLLAEQSVFVDFLISY